MESDDCEPSSCLKPFKSLRHSFFQFVKFTVYFYSYRLKGLFARVLLLADLQRYVPFYYFRKLQRCLYRCGFSRFKYTAYYAVCEFLLAVLEKYLFQLFLAVFVNNIIGAKPALAHSHIKRCVLVIGKSSLSRIKLIR